jgi:ParB-like chromosome segregation protein Spo0J
MAKLQATQTAGFNAGNTYTVKYIRLKDIVIDPEIANVFTISEKVLEEIKQKIMAFGYNKEEPVVIWKGHNNILLDGRTRYTAAMEAGLDEIPYVEREFENREEAILYTFERQVVRRNLTNSEIMAAARMIKGRKANDGTGRAADILAARLGISAATLFQARAIEKDAPDEIKEAVEKGDMSIKKGYKKTKGIDEEKEFTVNDAQSLPGNVSFLKSSVTLLVDAGQRSAAELLINHFLKKNEKRGFYGLLPEAVSAQLPRLPLVVR